MVSFHMYVFILTFDQKSIWKRTYGRSPYILFSPIWVSYILFSRFEHFFNLKSKYGNMQMTHWHFHMYFWSKVNIKTYIWKLTIWQCYMRRGIYGRLNPGKSTYGDPYVTVYMGHDIYFFSYVHARFSGIFLYWLVNMWVCNLRAMTGGELMGSRRFPDNSEHSWESLPMNRIPRLLHRQMFPVKNPPRIEECFR